MENKNLNDTSYTSRTERKQFEEEIKAKQLEREKELEARRKELKSILFDDEKTNKKKKITKENTNKPKAANIFLSIMYVAALFVFIFLILDSTNKIEQTYQIINAFLFLIIVTCFLVSFKKSFFKNKSAPTVVTSLAVLGTIAFNGLYLTDVINLPEQSYLPNFESKNLTKAINWTEENDVETKQNFEYSDVTQKYKVISQSTKAETLTKNVDKVDFVVSNGPDYNKEVILADMTGWDVDDVVKFAEENFLNSVTVNFEENDSIDNGIIIKQSKTGNIKRSDPIIFTASLGSKEELSPIKLKDLTNESLLRASVYLGKHGILYELKYEFSNTIQKGHVINSEPKENETVNPDDKITLTISKGKEIKVPNLKNKTMAYITKWMVENNLQINYSDKYDNEIKSGRVIESNYKEGDIIEEGTTVDITFSKGPLKMKKFDNIDDFKSWANENGIKYEIKEEFNENTEKDKIISISIKEGENISLEDTITITVSKGKAIKVPDFTNKTKSEVQKECNNLGLTCSFTEEYSTKVSSGKVISQSIASGTEVSKGDKITITIATSKKTTTSSKNNTSNSSSKNSSSNSNNTSNNSGSSGGSTGSGTTTNQCKSSSYNISIRPLNDIFNRSENYTTTKRLIENYFHTNFPGINIVVTGDPSAESTPGSYIGGFKGGTISCPSTVEIIIAK